MLFVSLGAEFKSSGSQLFGAIVLQYLFKFHTINFSFNNAVMLCFIKIWSIYVKNEKSIFI